MARERPIFELARFAWGAPDRLELSGKFIGLPDVPADAPTLVISGADGVHRLPVVPDSVAGPPEDGRRWDVVFAWQEPPVAFDVAELELGTDIVVELPEPAAKRSRSRRQTLTVGRERVEKEEVETERDGVQQLRARAELLGAQEELRQAHVTLQRTQEELSRARDELAAEQGLRSADAEWFHQALATMGDAAEQAVATELAEARQLIETKDATLAELGEQLEAASAARAEVESEARAEIDALRGRIVRFERAGEESERLREELAATRTQVDGARTELDQARSALDEARSDAERLLGRLTAARGAAGDGA